MSFISQNALRRKQINQVQEQGVNQLLLKGCGENEAAEDSGLVNLKAKKRKTIRTEDKKDLSLLRCRHINTNKDEQLQEDSEMKKLESILFGYNSLIQFGNEEEEARKEVNGSPLFPFTDRFATEVVTVREVDAEYQNKNNDGEETRVRNHAWIDSADGGKHFNIAKEKRLLKLKTKEGETSISLPDMELRLRAKFASMNPGTEWARIGPQPRIDDEDEDDDNHGIESIFRTDEDLVVKSNVKLFSGRLEYSRLVDANAENPSNASINSVQFHRNAQLLLAAGLDKRLRFFQIDGKRNNMTQSLFLEGFPIRKASFLPDGSQVIVAGRRNFFYSFDLEKARFDRVGPLIGREEKSLESFEVSPDSRTIAFLGNEGSILLVSCKTKELIGTLKMNASARSLAFTDDGRQLLSSGGDGNIYHWDLRTRTCFHKSVDEGCIMGSALCTSPNGALFSAGSRSGIVNIYNREVFLGGKRKPMKTIENLTTEVNLLKFNNDAQILAICSKMQRNSLKLVHIPSFTVFSNWPPQKRSLGYPSCLDFSPGGAFMAMGNSAGKVFLYRLHHYQHA